MTDVTNALLVARIRGSDFPASVEDTPANRQEWDQLGRDVDTMRARGLEPDVRWDYTEMD